MSPLAAGATASTTTLQIARTPSSLGRQIVLGAGFTVETSDGHVFAIAADVTFAPGATGPIPANVVAVVPGFASTSIAGQIVSFVSVAGQASGDVASVTIVAGVAHLIRGGGDFLFGCPLGVYVLFTAGANVNKTARVVAVSPDGSDATLDATDLVAESGTASWAAQEWASLGLSVTQPLDTTQGTDDELDAIGRELGRQRQTGETDLSYRKALLTLPETITPEAIAEICNRIVGPYGPVTIYEVRTSSDDADPVVGSLAWPGPIADVTPADVRPDLYPTGLIAVGARDRAYFLVRWDAPVVLDPGAYADDYAASPGPVLAGMPMSAAADVSPADGADFGAASFRVQIAAQINQAKGAGVRWAFYPPSYL